ncbi:plasmid mobilization relaxosome protein MobC [Mucilaginibacter sp. Mucisp84]|uniref:plasmid mobilization relaxosome protein MobC n=1 Tax=Mucilaginibacter sp. Mucisp84 TaxID=3243058 RepID=UPI0039A40FA1
MKSTEKRIKKIDARFTEEEYKLVLEMENTLGIRKTDLVRNGLLKNGNAVIINAKELIGQLDSAGAELGRSGNNINQLARHANRLAKKGLLSPVVVERFNSLLEQYLVNQKDLETALRKIVRSMH